MKVFLLAVSLLLTQALQELDAINDEERNDEVAQAQERSVIIACLYLAYNKIEVSQPLLEELEKSTKHTVKELTHKIAADILERCVSEVTWQRAEVILAEDNLDLEAGAVKELVKIDTEQLKGPIELNQKQKQLLEKIEKEINRKDEEIVPEPPKDRGYDLFEEESEVNYYYVGGGAAAVLVVAWVVLRKKGGNKPAVEVRDKKKKR